MIAIGGSGNDSIGKNRTEINIGSLKVYHGEDDKKEDFLKEQPLNLYLLLG
ncbi:hypothetical protein [Flavobacterium haoranii]|uniref:hypothetical protein n=1 Tax=Flavobacterium haoranii TaxID=683124 RepID=UPI00187B1E8D|nr:hypothetical protein [Flavobacterium haoranii]